MDQEIQTQWCHAFGYNKSWQSHAVWTIQSPGPQGYALVLAGMYAVSRVSTQNGGGCLLGILQYIPVRTRAWGMLPPLIASYINYCGKWFSKRYALMPSIRQTIWHPLLVMAYPVPCVCQRCCRIILITALVGQRHTHISGTCSDYTLHAWKHCETLLKAHIPIYLFGCELICIMPFREVVFALSTGMWSSERAFDCMWTENTKCPFWGE